MNSAIKSFYRPATFNPQASISDIEFHANIIHLKPKFLELIDQSPYQIYTESYSNFQSSALNANTITDRGTRQREGASDETSHPQAVHPVASHAPLRIPLHARARAIPASPLRAGEGGR